MKNLLARKADNRAKIIKHLKGKISEEQIDRFCMKNEINPKIAETIYLYLNNPSHQYNLLGYFRLKTQVNPVLLKRKLPLKSTLKKI